MRRFALTMAAASVAALIAAPYAAAIEFSPDRVIVEWAPGASPTERRAARADADVDFTRDLGDRRFQLVETEPGQTPRAAVRELEADPAVVVAERDGYDSEHAIPDDPRFGQLWGLQNTGLGIAAFEGALAGADIGAPSAWDRTVGSADTVVAVIDGGYRFEHPDLDDAVWTNPDETFDGADNDGNGIVDDIHGADFLGADAETPAIDGDPTDEDLFTGGHGVHTAGTIGAEGNNGIGITGVAQEVSLMPLKACSRFVLSAERGCTHSAEIEAVNYAGEKGARVANISLGGETSNAILAGALAANPETLYVISAGNEESNNELKPKYPCNYDPLAEGRGPVDNVICVAATDQADQLASFSNWGAKSVDLGAPGTEILSTQAIHAFVEDGFELDDFDGKWSASGADGGLARADEPQFGSFAMTDSPGAAPVAGSTRASTSVPATLPAGLRSCALEQTRKVTGGSLWVEVILDGETVEGRSANTSGRFTWNLLDGLEEGGELTLLFSYKASLNPGSNSGVWVDDIQLRCIALPGEADGYRFANGTSMAAPHVTGAAALLFSLKPSASVTEVRQALLGSVDPLPALAGKTTSGGRLDAAAAIEFLEDPPDPNEEPTDPGEEPTDPGGPTGPGTPPADPGGGGAGPISVLTPPPVSPAPAPVCVVPKLAGKTLARAKARLTAAACKLGTVRKPRPSKGKPLPPLVVKSSSPATGATPVSGKVNLTLGPKPRG